MHGIGGLAAESVAVGQQRTRLQAGIDRGLSDAWRGEPMLDPGMQFRQRLGSVAGGDDQSGAGQLLYALYHAVAQQQGVEVKQVRAGSDELEVDLQVATFADLEQLRAALAATEGMSESQLGADSDGGAVTARLRITRSGS